MTRNRMEAFSGGALAIIITIMVLKLKVPGGADFADLREDLPLLIGYVLYTAMAPLWIIPDIRIEKALHV